MPRCYMVKKNGVKFPKRGSKWKGRKGSEEGSESPTEAAMAPKSPPYYRNMDDGYMNEFMSQNSQDTVIKRAPVVTSHDGGIPIFRERSAEETEAAHDLLELSRSLPPLPDPVIVRVPSKLDESPDKKYSDSYSPTSQDLPDSYYENGEEPYKSDELHANGESRNAVSVVVRAPSSPSEKGFLGRYSASSLVPYNKPASPISDHENSVLPSENFGGKPGENFKVLPGKLSAVQYENPPASKVEETSSSSASADKNCAIPFEQNPGSLVIRMPPPQPQVTHLISSPVEEKIVSIAPEPSVLPAHVVQFTHIIPNSSIVMEERPQTSTVLEQVLSLTPGMLLPPHNLIPISTQTEPESGTNVVTNIVSYTPVIRFQSSSESAANNEKVQQQQSGTATKPPSSEYHSDTENNNPNLKQPKPPKKLGFIRKKRGNASCLPIEWILKKTPSGEKEKTKFSCSECGRKYATSSNLSRHKQTHRSLDSQSAKKCKTCGKAYVSMPALAMHMLTHKLSHACGVCGKMFSRPWLLQGHLRSHTGEKPYTCANCGKAFADRSNLRAHMQTHSFEKNYICLKCKKSFALKSYLSKHLESSCLKENNDIEAKSNAFQSPRDSVNNIHVETWSKESDGASASIEMETDEEMEEIDVV